MEYTVNNLETSALINDLILSECCLLNSLPSPLFFTLQSGLYLYKAKYVFCTCLKGLSTAVKIALTIPGFTNFRTMGYIYSTLSWMQSTRQHEQRLLYPIREYQR